MSEHYVARAIRKAVMHMETNYKLTPAKRKAHYQSVTHDLPYALLPNKSGLGGLLLVNRSYRPIGETYPTYVVYEDYPEAHVPEGSLCHRAFARYGNVDSRGYISLYDDFTSPATSRGNATSYYIRLQDILSCVEPLLYPGPSKQSASQTAEADSHSEVAR